MKIIRKKEQLTSKWAGGTTTELFIYPEGSLYKERNFSFRISTAKVDAEESTFTSLPNVSRHIMILDGELELNHKDQYKKKLSKLDIDSFHGSWETISKGKVTDFNLMLKGDYYGHLNSLILNKGEKITTTQLKKVIYIGLYVIKGELEIITKEKTNILFNNDFVIYSPNIEFNPEKTKIIAKEKSEIAVVVINIR